MQTLVSAPTNETRTISLLDVRFHEGLMILGLNDPPANTLSFDMIEEFDAILDTFFADRLLHAMLITGIGENYFCGGVNISMLKFADGDFANAFVRYAAEVFARIETASKPIVSAVNGHAMGGGLELALTTRYRFIKDADFQVGLPETRLGVIPGLGGTQRLRNTIGRHRSFRYLSEARLFSPNHALALGLFHRKLPAKQFLERAIDETLRLFPKTVSTVDTPRSRLRHSTTTPLDISHSGSIATVRMGGALCNSVELLRRLSATITLASKEPTIHCLVLDWRNIALYEPLEDREKEYLDYICSRLEKFPGLTVWMDEWKPKRDDPIDPHDPLIANTITAEIAFACDLRYVSHSDLSLLEKAPLATQMMSKRLNCALTELGISLPGGPQVTVKNASEFELVQLFEAQNFVETIRSQLSRYLPPVGARRAIVQIKHALIQGQKTDFLTGAYIERVLQAPLLTSLDASEGMTAYLGKRNAQFQE